MRKSLPKHTSVLASSTAMALALGTLGALSPAVMAQDEESQGAAGVLLEEIQVYGTKRSAAQKVQDVPAQVSAFSSRKLEVMQVARLTDLSMSTPSVTLDDIGTVPGTPNYSIRGLGVNSSIPSIDPAVAIFFNGAYVGAGQGAILNMIDMDGIEIHKGPQGVLFGRNVTGGALLLRTARPEEEFRVRGRFNYEDSMKTYRASVTGAVNDSLSARLAVYYKDDNGSFESANIARKIGKDDTVVVRPSIRFAPNETFELNMMYEYGDTEGDGPITQIANGFTPSNPSTEVESNQNHAGMLDLRWDHFTSEATLDVGDGRITNVFSYREVKQDAESDIDGGPLSIFHSKSKSNTHNLSNELRYNGQMSDTWDLTAGLYYQDSKLLYREGRALFQDSAFDPLVAVLGLPRVRYGGGGDQDSEIWGVFLNNYFDLNDRATVQAGIRYSNNDKSGTLYPLTTCTFNYGCAVPIAQEKSAKNWSPKLGLDYDLTEETKLYTHWARSYRAGGFNYRFDYSLLLALQAQGEDITFDKERIDSFEAGVKSSMMDNKLRFNGAVYMNYLSDMQREINLPNASAGVSQNIRNTGNARILGLEFDALAQVSDNFVINFGAGYIDGQYTSVTADLNSDGAINAADEALDIPRLPKWTYNLGMTYDVEMGDSGVLSLRADYAYRSASAYTDTNVGYFNSYDMINAGITFTPAGGSWSVSFYGKNLTNEAVLGGLTVLPGSFTGLSAALGQPGVPYFAPIAKGRRWGVDFSVDF